MSAFSIFRTEVSETDDSGELQTAKATGYAGEELTGAHTVRQHGFASHAPKGSHGFGLASRGERSLVALIGVEHQDKRPRNVAEGGAVVYDAAGNASRYLGADGIWHDAGARPQKMTGKTVDHMGTDRASIGASNGRTYLGGDGTTGIYARVMTESGPSNFVWARIS